MIHVLATIQIVPGKRAEFLGHFHDVMPHVHQEEGCLAYAPAVDLPTSIGAQLPLRPDVAVIVEQWESLAALEKHLIAPHMQAYRSKIKELVVSTELQILEPA
jgi:quinol monooxygenase YgiN